MLSLVDKCAQQKPSSPELPGEMCAVMRLRLPKLLFPSRPMCLQVCVAMGFQAIRRDRAMTSCEANINMLAQMNHAQYNQWADSNQFSSTCDNEPTDDRKCTNPFGCSRTGLYRPILTHFFASEYSLGQVHICRYSSNCFGPISNLAKYLRHAVASFVANPLMNIQCMMSHSQAYGTLIIDMRCSSCKKLCGE